MLDSQPPFTTAEAKRIVSRTTFVSESYGVWKIEIKSFTHTGTLVEATAGDKMENLDDHDGLPSAEPITETEDETGHRTSLTCNEKTFGKESKIVEYELEKEYRAIEELKEDLISDERAQMNKMVEIMNLKRYLANKVAELHQMETTTMQVKREAIKKRDKEYYNKLKKHKDAEVAVRKQANEERLAGLTNQKFWRLNEEKA
jgi:hypothetical protein